VGRWGLWSIDQHNFLLNCFYSQFGSACQGPSGWAPHPIVSRTFSGLVLKVPQCKSLLDPGKIRVSVPSKWEDPPQLLMEAKCFLPFYPKSLLITLALLGFHNSLHPWF
jgi:hypothetical protein